MSGAPMSTRKPLGAQVSARQVESWVQSLIRILGSKRKVCQELSERYGGKPSRWDKWMERNKHKDSVLAERAEQVWALLTDMSPEATGEWYEQSWYLQPTWRVTGLDSGGSPRMWYFISPGKARRRAETLKAQGLLLEVARTDGPWREVDEIPDVKSIRKEMSR